MLASPDLHRDFHRFLVSTAEIGVNGLQLSLPVKPDALNALIFEPNSPHFSFTSSGVTQVDFSLTREAEVSFLIGVNTKLELFCPCVRCLLMQPFDIVLDFSIRMIEKAEILEEDLVFDSFLEPGHDAGEDFEIAVGYFSDKCIDLGLILREQIYLSVPDYPQCGGENARNRKACHSKLVRSNEHNDTLTRPFARLLKPHG